MRSCVLVLSGLPGSGKSEAAKYFTKKNFPVIRMGTLTETLLQKTKGEKKEREIRENLRKRFGNDVYAQWAVEQMKGRNKDNIVIIDGLRSNQELEYFNSHLPCVKLIYIEAGEEIRYDRLVNRKMRPLTKNEAQRRDRAELYTLGLNDVKQKADYILVNDRSLEKLYMQLEKIISQMK